MSGQGHDRGVANLRLGKLRNRVVPQIVKTQTRQRAFYVFHFCFAIPAILCGVLNLAALRAKYCPRQAAPRRSPTPLTALGVDMAILTGRDDEMVGLIG